ncbi:MAG: PTS sugar transporter subunit IIA [Verrucomicrobia bacterium]|nr:PTS sugar transporter subunit IIA [Verrucomicrobiota bacterium]MBV8482849.1 PTS sugar transporter subunit IIA [Verrucomicrobiota bacterium]
MIRIREILLPKQILLNVKATTREEAITMVSDSLKGDNRIIDWSGFTHCLGECERSGKVNMGLGLTIPHGRADSVISMVMAFGRLAQPIRRGPASIRFVLVIGIPETMDADYLRLVGVLMRAFRDDQLRKALETAETPEDVLATFETGETKLV